jgi:acetoacetyl-CoA synthetase
MLRVRHELGNRCSPAHVPSVVAQVNELPQTHNGKRAERAARDAVNGDPVANIDALKNPGSLEAIRNHPAVQLHASAPISSLPAGGAEWNPALSRDEVEKRLIPLWEAALGADRVGLNDNFQDLGGHSLIGISLLVRVESTFGRRLPMGTFLGAGATISGMARELVKPPSEQKDSLLVAVQPNGHRLPAYWLPGGGGVSTMAFREVSLMLGPDQPVFGFEAPLEQPDRPRDLRATARMYIEELRASHPGPYVLFGFSYGSYMAFEVGCQLRAAGERVALLAVFDTPAPQELSWAQRATVLAQRSGYHLKRLKSNPKLQMAFAGNALSERVESIKSRISPPPPAPEQPGQKLFEEVNRRNIEAIHEYAKGPLPVYPGRITVFLAEQTSYSAVSPDLDERLAWRHFAKEGIDVRHVSGSHLSMLTKPDATKLASELRAALDAVQDERAGAMSQRGAALRALAAQISGSAR